MTPTAYPWALIDRHDRRLLGRFRRQSMAERFAYWRWIFTHRLSDVIPFTEYDPSVPREEPVHRDPIIPSAWP